MPRVAAEGSAIRARERARFSRNYLEQFLSDELRWRSLRSRQKSQKQTPASRRGFLMYLVTRDSSKTVPASARSPVQLAPTVPDHGVVSPDSNPSENIPEPAQVP